jgi:O-antigen ligase
MRHQTLSNPAHPGAADRTGGWLAPAAVVGIELLCLLLFLKFASFPAVVGFFVLPLILYLISFSVRNTLIAMFLSVSLLPVYAWGSRYKFFKGIYYNEIIVYFFLALIIVWALYDRLAGNRREPMRWSGLDINLGLFLIYVVFMALRGLVENPNTQIIYNEAHHLLLYGFFFIYARLLSDRDMMDVLHAVPVVTGIVSIEFILLVASEGGLSSIFVKRIVTQQPHLAQVAVPLLAGSFLLPQKRIRLWSVAIFLPIAAMVFFCQQRGLWVGVFLATVLVLVFNFLKNRFTVFRFLKVILALVLILALLAGVLWIIDRLVTGSVFFTLFERLFSLTTVGTDTSMNIRMSEIRRALDLWDNSPVSILFGTGLGSEYDTVDINRTYGYSVDNSFAFLLWKTGLVGLLLFVFIFLNTIRKGFSLLRFDLPPEHRHAASASTAALIGLCFIAFTNACIVSYRFILIWSFLITVLHRLHSIHLSKARA